MVFHPRRPLIAMGEWGDLYLIANGTPSVMNEPNKCVENFQGTA
jgi:hypothetical protein